jgi:hypothetical protein
VPEYGKDVIVLGGSGPIQSDMGAEEIVIPLRLIVKVPQNAKEVLVEPVVLLIARTSVAVIGVGSVGLQVWQPVPVNVAPTSSKSLEVHLSGEGNVWANAFAANNTPNKARRVSRSQEVAALLIAKKLASGKTGV